MPAEGCTHTTIDNSVLRRRLADPNDDQAWRLVADRYGPPIEGFARQLGLGPEDVADVRQETLLAFAVALRAGKFAAERGGLRDFLFGIARHKVLDAAERLRKACVFQPADSAVLRQAPAEDRWADFWSSEWETAVRGQCLREAQARFSADTYLVFHLKAIEGLSSAEVARPTGKTAAAVDMATHHVRRFLQEVYPIIAEIF